MSIFNTHGELNALDNQEALEAIVKYASVIQKNQSANQNLAGRASFTEEQKDELSRPMPYMAVRLIHQNWEEAICCFISHCTISFVYAINCTYSL